MPEKGSLATLFDHPYIMLFIAICGVLLLIIPLVVLWQLKMLTGVVFAIIILVIAYALTSMKLINLTKYPSLGPIIIALTIGGFIFGYIGERTGAFFVTPLSQKATPALLVETAEPTTFITANIEVILLFIFMLAILFGWSKREG